MRVLIYGAGVIGSIFGGRLSKAGHDVTILARGKRYCEIKNDGLIITQANSQIEEKFNVKVIDKLLENDIYDYIFVVMQKTQVSEVLPIISQNNSNNIVFVVNNALGYDKWAESLGKERLLIGFPSAGGERINGVVNYFIGRGIIRCFQTTTFSEYNGTSTKRLEEIIKIFNRAEIPAVACSNMDAWQKTHVAMVTSIANALYKYNGDNYKLSKVYKDIELMIRGIKEGFMVLKALDYSITPVKLNFFRLPTPLLTCIFKIVMGTKLAETTMAKHTVVARGEMKCLQGEFDQLILKSGVSTPNIDELRKYLYAE